MTRQSSNKNCSLVNRECWYGPLHCSSSQTGKNTASKKRSGKKVRKRACVGCLLLIAYSFLKKGLRVIFDVSWRSLSLSICFLICPFSLVL